MVPGTEPVCVGVDIGGTKVAAGAVDAGGQVLEQLRRATPTTRAADIEEALVAVVAELRGRHDVAAVGVGAAGFVDADRSTVLFSPHLAWRREPLRAALEERLRLPVVVENDANAAGWAEWRFGAARGEAALVCVTVGTGIGGALLLDGRIVRGASGIAGEFGHMTLVLGGRRCSCGKRGCWEEYASGNALVREARELCASGSPVAQDLLSRVEGDLDALTGPVILAAAQDGDAAAVELFEELGQALGVGLASLASAVDPGCFVIGGGVADAGELLLGPAREAYLRALPGRGYRPEARIVVAELGGAAGLVGAADLAARRIAGSA